MEPLLDPCFDRQVKEAPLPPRLPMSHEVLFPKKLNVAFEEIPDWKTLKDHLHREGKINKPDLL
jgi:hypothetical protein